MNPILKARKKVAAEIVDGLLYEMRQGGDISNHKIVDTERLYRRVESEIPLSNVEAQAEWDASNKEIQDAAGIVPKKPGYGERLRDVLGFHNGAPLGVILEAAIEAATKCAALEAQRDELQNELADNSEAARLNFQCWQECKAQRDELAAALRQLLYEVGDSCFKDDAVEAAEAALAKVKP